MGLASGDVDGDLDLDLLVTNFDDESDTLYVNLGGLSFEDRTVSAGLEAITRLPVGFGTLLADLDHDGDLDWAVANGPHHRQHRAVQRTPRPTPSAACSAPTTDTAASAS